MANIYEIDARKINSQSSPRLIVEKDYRHHSFGFLAEGYLEQKVRRFMLENPCNKRVLRRGERSILQKPTSENNGVELFMPFHSSDIRIPFSSLPFDLQKENVLNIPITKDDEGPPGSIEVWEINQDGSHSDKDEAYGVFEKGDLLIVGTPFEYKSERIIFIEKFFYYDPLDENNL